MLFSQNFHAVTATAQDNGTGLRIAIGLLLPAQTEFEVWKDLVVSTSPTTSPSIPGFFQVSGASGGMWELFSWAGSTPGVLWEPLV